MILLRNISLVALGLFCTLVSAPAQTPPRQPRPQAQARPQTPPAALPSHGVFVYSNLCTRGTEAQGYRVVLIRLTDGDYIYLKSATGPTAGQAGYNLNLDAGNFVFFFDGNTSGAAGTSTPNVFRGTFNAVQMVASVGDPLSSVPLVSVTLKRVTDFDAAVPGC